MKAKRQKSERRSAKKKKRRYPLSGRLAFVLLEILKKR